MRHRGPIRRIGRDARGVTAVEFALIAAPLFVVLFGLVDLGYRQLVATVLQGALDQAARQVTIGNVTSDTVDTFIRGRMSAFAGTVTIDKKTFNDFSRVGKPEKITTDIAPIGTYNAGDCFEDLNGNGSWDAQGGKSGVGGSEDIVYYTATATFRTVLPLRNLLGWQEFGTATATMMMKNQPFAGRQVPATICS
ncbi:TadE/TadG family type IV pilus assembly protein [Sphingomonas sp.]|uniref:TadE/TadG family type IV pilus assembly protein n=1 Tax=Sphingomonas sp. TaxID=28214 RepID=UPI002EDA165A